jgi:uncharacterized protein involved in exopolysaccharide biosynthesis
MAVREPKDLLTRLADAGEEAIQKLADAPGADRLLGAVQSLRERMDELQKKVRGIDALEQRVAELEKRVDALGGSSTTTPKTPAKRTTASKTTKTRSTSAKKSSI